MKPKHWPVEQMSMVLKEVDAGVPVGEVCRKYGLSRNTLLRWR